MNDYTILDNKNIDYLYKELFDSNDELKILPASFYHSLEPIDLMLIGHNKAIYTFPTLELIEWLEDNYNLNNAIEICSGNGVLARALQIMGTDSKIQLDPIVKQQFDRINQPIVNYSDKVIKIDAINAIKKYKPSIVIGSWVTELYNPESKRGVYYGTDERFILNHVDTYIHIGNSKIHGGKKILSEDHTEYKPDWLISRSKYYTDNVIYIWNNE